MHSPMPRFEDVDRLVDRFGVQPRQVMHDYVVSIVLEAIAQSEVARDVTFVGGTALHRTFLNSRLSEDIDLLVRDRKLVVPHVLAGVSVALRAVFGEVSLSDATRGRCAGHVILRVTEQAVNLQFLPAENYPDLPVVHRRIDMRFSGFGATGMNVLTAESFIVAKTIAWCDETRHASRDLYDLWALAEAGFFSGAAVELYRRVGPTGHVPLVDYFPRAPEIAKWHAELGHQGRIDVLPNDARDRVVSEWGRLVPGFS